MIKIDKTRYLRTKLAHLRDLIWYEEWFWGCEHKDYTNEQVLEWETRANKKRSG